MVILAGLLAAQTLNDIVIQAWIDPVYGVDGPATVVDNPRAGSPSLCNPSEVSPPDVLNLAGTKVLHHASYPYKTIGAAISYITTVTGGLPGGGLPYTASTGAVWQYAIIHCLPGKYAWNTNTMPDLHNRVPGNGESFPIDLPNRVSVQGTSALNTVFDLFDPNSGASGRGVGPAFRFGLDSDHSGEHSFVDSVSIFGARPNSIIQGAEREASAIYLAREVACSPTISNCFLFANGVGILVDEVAQNPVTHTPTIVNNTIAFNKVGIWNGDAQAPVSGPATAGTAAMLLINNIFDIGMSLWYEVIPQHQPFTGCATTPVPFPPTWYAWVNSFNGSGSAFEGVDVGDLTVTTPVPADFNAYDTTYGLVAPFFALDLPPTSGGALPAAPGVDLTPIIGVGQSRGALYVRDLMHIGHINAVPTGSAPYQPGTAAYPTGVACEFDRSPGDFRLAPAHAAAFTPSGPPFPPSALNLLVDVGFSGPFPVTMANGRVLTAPPGTLPMGNSSWPYHSWMHDCEGFGNPRIVLHPGFYANTSNMAPRIDIGADEVDVHPLAGYRFGTTHFLEWNDANVQSNNYHGWLLGPPWTLTPAPLPGNTALPFESNRMLTTTSAIWGVTTLPPPYAYYTPTTTDVVPHLLPDIHPHWILLSMPSPSPTYPIWQVCKPYHNFLLYEDPTTGVINPPGSADGAFSAPGFNWIEGFSFQPIAPGAGQTWHATPGTQGNPTVFRYDIWCQSERPNGIPGPNQPFDDWYDMRLGVSAGQFRRFSTEYQSGNVPFSPDDGSNLQSYAVHRQPPQ